MHWATRATSVYGGWAGATSEGSYTRESHLWPSGSNRWPTFRRRISAVDKDGVTAALGFTNTHHGRPPLGAWAAPRLGPDKLVINLRLAPVLPYARQTWDRLRWGVGCQMGSKWPS